MKVRICVLFLIAAALTIASHAQTVVVVHTTDNILQKLASLNGQPGTLVLDPGDHYTSDTLYLASGQCVRGSYGQSILHWTGPAPGVATKAVISVAGSRGAVIGTLSANTTQSVTINVSGSPAAGPVEILKADGTQREDDDLMTTTAGYRLRRRPFLLYPNGADLYALNAVDDVTVRDLRIDAGVAYYGIFVQYARNFRLEDSTISNATFGIFMRDAFRTVITRSRFKAPALIGIRVESSTVGDINNTTVVDSAQTGISICAWSNAFTVRGNEIDGTGVTNSDGIISGGDGIGVNQTFFMVIANNRILGPNCYGLEIGDQAEDTVISGNMILGGLTGAIVENNGGTNSAREVVITANIAANNNGGSIGLLPGHATDVLHNILDLIRGGGVSGMDSSEVIYNATVPTGN